MAADFDPVRLRRSPQAVDPGTIVAALAALFLGLAVLKPWDAAPSNGPRTADDRPIPAVPRPSTSDPAPTAGAPTAERIRPNREPATSWQHVAEALAPRDAWGIAAFVDRKVIDGLARPRGARLFERWTPVEVAPPATPSTSSSRPAAGDAVRLPTSDEPVRVLGITSPADARPMDVRVWWLRPGEPPRWLHTPPVDASAPDGHLYLLPPRRADGTAATWPTGTYRIDLLLEGGIARMLVLLPASVATADPPDRSDPFAPTTHGDANRRGPGAIDVADLPVGPFVVAGGRVVPIDLAPSHPLDEIAAWLTARTGLDGDGPAVARLWLPEVTRIGLRLPPGSTVVRVRVLSLAPGPADDEPAGLPGRLRRPPSGFEAVLIRAPAGLETEWPPGSYVIDAAWFEDGTLRSGSWHLTLLPGPPDTGPASHPAP